MTDKISKERRSANMRAVHSRDTGPEIRVRQIAHGLGYRFRLHRRELPGKPDLAFPGQRKAIFVHGCFWHQHKGCERGSMPQSNVGFWRPKLAHNAARDAKQLTAIKESGWRAMVIWECELKNERRLVSRLRRFLG
ncbi:MAG TPA: very short patch repair endonuclease [Burkholderiales bacterium]|nr:very short patch repair endonuclease [Burkholderiales bacterium]